MAGGGGAELTELRVLDGPNLYFTRPAVKLTLAVPGWLDLPEEKITALAARFGLPGISIESPSRTRVRPGPPGTEHRRRFVARTAAHITRELAATTGSRLAVRARTGPEPDQIVVAFPWRRREAAEALGREVAEMIGQATDARRSPSRLLQEARARVERVDPGPPPSVRDPSIRVVAVTGTNGKTTSVRLLAHLVRTAGLSVAFSSTDGVYVDGRLVEEGDYSGFGGAAKAMASPAWILPCWRPPGAAFSSEGSGPSTTTWRWSRTSQPIT